MKFWQKQSEFTLAKDLFYVFKHSVFRNFLNLNKTEKIFGLLFYSKMRVVKKKSS